MAQTKYVNRKNEIKKRCAGYRKSTTGYFFGKKTKTVYKQRWRPQCHQHGVNETSKASIPPEANRRTIWGWNRANLRIPYWKLSQAKYKCLYPSKNVTTIKWASRKLRNDGTGGAPVRAPYPNRTAADKTNYYGPIPCTTPRFLVYAHSLPPVDHHRACGEHYDDFELPVSSRKSSPHMQRNIATNSVISMPYVYRYATWSCFRCYLRIFLLVMLSAWSFCVMFSASRLSQAAFVGADFLK